MDPLPPLRLRWLAPKHPPLLDFALKALLQRVWATQRRHARRLGGPGRLHPGAVSFTQNFGSTLHADASPDGDVEQLRAHALQQALAFATSAQSLAAVQPRKHHRRLAVVDGFSLHADTFVHEADRQGLERLCRYGARGPLAEERLSRLDDGRYAYRLRRPSHSGATSLVFTAAQLVKRLAPLLPPPRRHLIRFHGVFGPNARLRPAVVRLARPPQAQAPSLPRAELPFPEQPAPQAPPRPRVDWATLLRHTFNLDLLQCPCGGRRRILAAVVSPAVAEQVLRHLGRLPPRPQLATGPPPCQSNVGAEEVPSLNGALPLGRCDFPARARGRLTAASGASYRFSFTDNEEAGWGV